VVPRTRFVPNKDAACFFTEIFMKEILIYGEGDDISEYSLEKVLIDYVAGIANSTLAKKRSPRWAKIIEKRCASPEKFNYISAGEFLDKLGYGYDFDFTFGDHWMSLMVSDKSAKLPEVVFGDGDIFDNVRYEIE
jgi:hypothetical protein